MLHCYSPELPQAGAMTSSETFVSAASLQSDSGTFHACEPELREAAIADMHRTRGVGRREALGSKANILGGLSVYRPTAVRSQHRPSSNFSLSGMAVGVAGGSQRDRDGLCRVSLGAAVGQRMHADPLRTGISLASTWGGIFSRHEDFDDVSRGARPATTIQGCHNGRFWMKITVRTSTDVVWTSARIRVYSANAVLPADGFLPSANAVKTRPLGRGPTWTCARADVAWMRGRVRADAGPRDRASTQTCVDTHRAATGPRGCGAASAQSQGCRV
jgi:hypothetical protein